MRRYVVRALILGVILFITFGQMLIVPPLNYLGGFWGLHQFMGDCPENEIRVERFGDSTDYLAEQQITLNLDTGSLGITSEYPHSVGHDLFWMQSPYPIGYPSPFIFLAGVPMPPPSLTNAQLAEARKIIDGLKPPGDSTASYRQKAHLAYWSQGRLVLEHFSASDTAQLRELSAALQLQTDYLQIR